MPRVSLNGIEVLEDLLREVQLTHEQLLTARDETVRHHELKMEDLSTSLDESANRLEQTIANESRLNAEIATVSDSIDSLSHEIDSLESQL
jgi:hypothetical protein